MSSNEDNVRKNTGREAHGAPWARLIALVVLTAGTIAAYANSFGAPFVFDGLPSITLNRTIRSLWPIGRVFRTIPMGQTVSGRPVLNLSFALNYAAGEYSVRGYHVANLEIHILAALALFGIVYRTLERRPNLAGSALAVAFGASFLWALHPLQTESVTYVVQRAESMMGLFYLVTLYAFIRGTSGSVFWYALSILACLLGAGTKEVIVSAPIMVLLYDRTFVAGTFREALRVRWRVYLGLAATWILLAYGVLSASNRGGTSGFGSGVSFWTYLRTQFPAAVDYLRLSFWPHPLVFDYATEWSVGTLTLILSAAFVLALAVAAAWALFRPAPEGTAAETTHRYAFRAAGFCGAWFFAILAPTSLIPGNRQTMAEHRMYLALAPIAVLVALGLWKTLGRRCWPAYAALGLALGVLTAHRNEVYRTSLSLWSDTLVKRPLNPYAHYSLGTELSERGDRAGAVEQFQEALKIKPDYPEVHNNLGNAYVAFGRMPEALVEFREAARLEPRMAAAFANIGSALLVEEHYPEAIAQFEIARRLDPDFAEVYNGLGDAYMRTNRLAEAIPQFETAIRLSPRMPEAHNNLGNALLRENRISDAKAQFEEAVRDKPEFGAARNGLGTTLYELGHRDEALEQFKEAVHFSPDDAVAHLNYGNVLASAHRLEESLVQFEAAVRLNPGDVIAHTNYGSALAQSGRVDAAAEQYREALRIRPDFDRARQLLARLPILSL